MPRPILTLGKEASELRYHTVTTSPTQRKKSRLPCRSIIHHSYIHDARNRPVSSFRHPEGGSFKVFHDGGGEEHPAVLQASEAPKLMLP